MGRNGLVDLAKQRLSREPRVRHRASRSIGGDWVSGDIVQSLGKVGNTADFLTLQSFGIQNIGGLPCPCVLTERLPDVHP